MKSSRYVNSDEPLAKAVELAQILCRPEIQREQEYLERKSYFVAGRVCRRCKTVARVRSGRRGVHEGRNS